MSATGQAKCGQGVDRSIAAPSLGGGAHEVFAGSLCWNLLLAAFWRDRAAAWSQMIAPGWAFDAAACDFFDIWLVSYKRLLVTKAGGVDVLRGVSRDARRTPVRSATTADVLPIGPFDAPELDSYRITEADNGRPTVARSRQVGLVRTTACSRSSPV